MSDFQHTAALGAGVIGASDLTGGCCASRLTTPIAEIAVSTARRASATASHAGPAVGEQRASAGAPPPAGPGSGLMSTADAEAPGHRAACTRVCGLERAADALGPPPACARDAGSQPVAQELLAFSRPI